MFLLLLLFEMKYSKGSNKIFENSSQIFSNSEGKIKEFDVLLLLLFVLIL